MSVDEVVQSGATRVPPLHVVGDCSYCSCSMVTDLVQCSVVLLTAALYTL